MKSDEEFIRLLKESRETQFRVAESLTRKGCSVRIVPHLVRPEQNQWERYVDDGDLEITHRIECKHKLKYDFNSVDSYPFDTVYLDPVRKLVKPYKVKLYGYAIVNAGNTGCLWVPGATRKDWIEEEVYDRRDDAVCLYYSCPREKTKYVEL